MKYSYNLINSFLKEKIPLKKIVDTITYHIGEVEYFKVGKDYCLDVELPANRYSDLGSHFGLAKDLCLILNIVFVEKEEEKIKKESDLKIEVKTKDCNAYYGTLIKDIKEVKTVDFIKEALITCGLRPLNGLVDITNFVMLEYGQPMHVFDYDKIEKGIIVKNAKKEKFITLDNREVDLNESCMVIADFKDNLAIGGVKGGKKAEVDKGTKNIVLEAANFDAHSIYLCSRNINLVTDASGLYSHDLSVKLVKKATKRAMFLLKKYFGAKNMGTTCFIRDVKEEKLVLNISKLNQFAGYDFSVDFVLNYLKKNKFNFKKINTES
jgi:phenylalanyl-tRNA synthetase beta chain